MPRGFTINTYMKHLHHIIPKHMGGSDDPSNLVELTVEEHAHAHLALFEKYGKKEDLGAYHLLLNGWDDPEAVRLRCSVAGSKSQGKRSKQENAQHLVKAREVLLQDKKENPDKWTEIYKQANEVRLRTFQTKLKDGWQCENWFDSNHGKKMAAQNNSQTKCPHCGKEGQYRAMKRWHFDNCSSF
jgi:hypothetical protein